MYIAIEGCIASGKSSTATLLADSLGFARVKEQTLQHPFISQFYADQERFAFETELAFALIHYHQLNQLQTADIVADFSPAKDLVFADLNLSGREHEMFMSLYDMLNERVPQPDIAVFLDLPVEECWQRCVARGRPFEAGIKLRYLEQVREQYLRTLERLGKEVRILEIHPDESRRDVLLAVESLIR
jgi:deoxyguanosine kinase